MPEADRRIPFSQSTGWPLQAGPQYNGDDLLLEVENYTQSVLTDPSIDITSYLANAGFSLRAAEEKYLDNQAINNVPYYGLATLNSNSWVDGILLKQGICQATIDGWVANLETQTLLTSIAYSNGAPLLPCFQGQIRHTNVVYGGCRGQ